MLFPEDPIVMETTTETTRLSKNWIIEELIR